MLWVAALLALAVLGWFLLSLRPEPDPRISLDEMVVLTEDARLQPELARALAHREAIRATRGDPDGTDPVATDQILADQILVETDQRVREVAGVARALFKARRRQRRAGARKDIVGLSLHKSVRGSGSADAAIDSSARSLDEAVQRMAGEIALLEAQAELQLGELERIRKAEQARALIVRRPPRLPVQVAPPEEASGLRELATRAVEAVREITSPRHALVPAMAGFSSPSLSATPRASSPAPTPEATVPTSSPAPELTDPHRAGGQAPAYPPHREPTRMRGARVLGRTAPAIEVRTSPAVKPLTD